MFTPTMFSRRRIPLRRLEDDAGKRARLQEKDKDSEAPKRVSENGQDEKLTES